MRVISGNLDQTNVRKHRKRDSLRKIGNAYQGRRGRRELDMSGERFMCESQGDRSGKSDRWELDQES